jgi:putative phage-type endonuclease
VLTEELQRTEEWFLARSGRLTASRFGAALGLSPYQSRQELWRQLTGRAEPFQGNPATDWGQLHEASAVLAYEIATGNLVEPAGFIEWSNWSGCSPDGWVLDGRVRGIVEIKCPFSQRIYEDIPEYYRAQVLGQLAITGAAWCDFICWTPDGHRIWRVDPQPKTWDRMEKALKEFWQYVMQGVEPKRAKRFNLQEQ